MYKKQMGIQRILCILAVIAGALVFLYSLGILTDLYEMLYPLEGTRDVPDIDTSLYFDMQGFNRRLEWIGIGLILVSCTLFITNTHQRRRYYVSNWVSTILVFGCNAAAAVWTVTNLVPYRARFLDLDFDAIEIWLAEQGYIGNFTRSTFWFDAVWGVFGFALIISVLLIVNAIWKNTLMARERDLLRGNGKAVLS